MDVDLGKFHVTNSTRSVQITTETEIQGRMGMTQIITLNVRAVVRQPSTSELKIIHNPTEDDIERNSDHNQVIQVFIDTDNTTVKFG